MEMRSDLLRKVSTFLVLFSLEVCLSRINVHSHPSGAAFVGLRPAAGPDTIKNSSSSTDKRKIICNGFGTPDGQPYELSLEEWLHQPTDNSLQLCDPLFTPSNTKADLNKPVQVFVLLGQSNMVGMAHIHGDNDGTLEYMVEKKKRFQHLLANLTKNTAPSTWLNSIKSILGLKEFNWTIRHDIRNVGIMGEQPAKITKNEWLTVSGSTFGPELQFGYIMAELLDQPVLLLKSCIGNRALGWDLLPPSVTKPFDYNGYRYPPYGGYPEKWPIDKTPDPPKPGSWYAGKEYDIDVANAKSVLANLMEYYPLSKRYEIAGFLWWQGDRDRRDGGHAQAYEQNMVQFIQSIRKSFGFPRAKFVLATIGMDGYNMTGDTLKVFESQMAVSGDAGKYPQFKGNVLSMDIRSSYRGGGYHYGNNADTYMEVGNALGLAMAKLLYEEH